MNLTPSPETDRVGFGPVAALAAAQLAAGVLAALLALLLPGGGAGLSAVGGLVGGMSYALWAEGRSPGCLTPSLARRLALWASLVQLVFAAPFVALLALASREPLPLAVWIAILLAAALVAFLVTWLGLAQGRRIAEKARRKKDGNG